MRRVGAARRLGHPVFTSAVAVLAVNDHLLKPAVGGWVTGKLSDVAGLFVVAVLAGVLTGRPRPAAMVCGVGFTLLKLVPAVAVLAAPALGGVTRTDPTDLVALLVLPAAAAFVAKERTDARRSLAVVATGVAILVTTATSCTRPDVVDGLTLPEEGTIVAHIATGEYSSWAVSDDGGETWRPTDDGAEPEDRFPQTTQACSTNAGCFRIRDERVEHRPDDSGTWQTSFAFTDEQRQRMELRTERCSGTEMPKFAAVTIAERTDGDHVVVALGNQGVLHRSPDGTWSRRAVVDCEPVPLTGPTWLADLAWSPLVVFFSTPLIGLLGWRRRGAATGAAAAATAGAGSVLLFSALGFFNFAAVDFTVYGPLIATASVAVCAVSVVLAVRRPKARRWEQPQPLR